MRWLRRWWWGQREESGARPELPAVRRTIAVRPASLERVRRWLADYAAVQRGGEDVMELALCAFGDAVCVRFPPRSHPYWFHNLALWLADEVPTLVAWSVPLGESEGEQNQGYWLVPDPVAGDHLSGYGLDGHGSIAVYVPSNDVARGLTLQHPPRSLAAVLAASGFPAGLESAEATHDTLRLAFEPLGAALNAGLRTTSRASRPPIDGR